MGRKRAVIDLASCDVPELCQMADTGDVRAMEVLRKRVQDNPQLANRHGDIGMAARGARLKRMMRDAPGARLIVTEVVEDMIRQLSGENPAPLEKQLAECVAMCWIDLQDHQHRYSLLGPRNTPKEFEWRSRMIDGALRRYLAAMKTLADVRRFKLPPIQVNIGDKQINTLGIEATGATQGNLLGNHDHDS